jgi:hypothetical protein
MASGDAEHMEFARAADHGKTHPKFGFAGRDWSGWAVEAADGFWADGHGSLLDGFMATVMADGSGGESQTDGRFLDEQRPVFRRSENSQRQHPYRATQSASSRRTRRVGWNSQLGRKATLTCDGAVRCGRRGRETSRASFAVAAVNGSSRGSRGRERWRAGGRRGSRVGGRRFGGRESKRATAAAPAT